MPDSDEIAQEIRTTQGRISEIEDELSAQRARLDELGEAQKAAQEAESHVDAADEAA